MPTDAPEAKTHQERHLKAEVRVTASCMGTSRGPKPQNFAGENFATFLDSKISRAKFTHDEISPPL